MIRFLIIIILIIITVSVLFLTYYPKLQNIERLGQFSYPFNMYNEAEFNKIKHPDYVPYVNYKNYPKLQPEDKNYNGFNVYTFIPSLLPNKVIEKMGNFSNHAYILDYDTKHNHIDNHVTFKKYNDVSPNNSKPSWSSFQKIKADKEGGNDCSKITDPDEKKYCESIQEDVDKTL